MSRSCAARLDVPVRQAKHPLDVVAFRVRLELAQRNRPGAVEHPRHCAVGGAFHEDRRRQLIDGDGIGGEHRKPLGHVAQLADVAGPVVGAQRLPPPRVDRRGGPAVRVQKRLRGTGPRAWHSSRRSRSGGTSTVPWPGGSRGLRGIVRLEPVPRDRGWWRRGCARRPARSSSRRCAALVRPRGRAAVSTAARSMSPISSRKSVPPSACFEEPRFMAFASVNAPRRVPEELVLDQLRREWPRSSGLMNGPARRARSGR